MGKKLRLILFEDCNRNCEDCCNKDFDIKNLPVCTDYKPYDKIMLTGGEPMLNPALVVQVINEIRVQTKAPIILYTADTSSPLWLFMILSLIDGVTVTIHDSKDIPFFMEFDKNFTPPERMKDSLRLNIFKGVGFVPAKPYWNIKYDIEWIKNCPLPKGEVLMRYKK